MPIKQITVKVIKRGRATDYRVEVKPGTEGEQPKMSEAVYLLAIATQMVIERSYLPENPETQP